MASVDVESVRPGFEWRVELDGPHRDGRIVKGWEPTRAAAQQAADEYLAREVA